MQIRIIKRFIFTLFISLLYCWAWMFLEKMFYGAITNRMIDNVMMLLFMPFIYIATDKFVE